MEFAWRKSSQVCAASTCGANSVKSCSSFKTVPPDLGIPLTCYFYQKVAPMGFRNLIGAIGGNLSLGTKHVKSDTPLKSGSGKNGLMVAGGCAAKLTVSGSLYP